MESGWVKHRGACSCFPAMFQGWAKMPCRKCPARIESWYCTSFPAIIVVTCRYRVFILLLYAVISKCCSLFPISLKLRANSLDTHREIGASASQGNKGLMRARIGVKPRSKNITSGCLVSLSPSATLHHAMAFHIVLSINTSCKSSGSGSAAWFQEGNRKLGSLWKIWSNQHHSTEHLTKRWLQSRSAKCQVVPQRLRKLRRLPRCKTLQDNDEWLNWLNWLNVSFLEPGRCRKFLLHQERSSRYVVLVK